MSAFTSSPFSRAVSLLEEVSDPNLAIIAKSLQKRDSVTKYRATEELLLYIRNTEHELDSQGQDSVIKIFIHLYPGVSIEVDRKVRSNAHLILQTLLNVSYGKKVIKQMREIAGSWMIGCHDTDRSVSRLATLAFESCLTTDEKRTNFWKLYKESIYDKAYDYVFLQDSKSLSDARFVSLEDAEAKYSNVAGASLRVLAQLVSKSERPEEEIKIIDLLTSKKLWKILEGGDAILKRAGLLLLQNGFASYPECLGEPDLHFSLKLAKVVYSIEAANVRELLETLSVVANIQPDLLFQVDASKKSLHSRFVRMIREVSGPSLSSQYWGMISSLSARATEAREPSETVYDNILSAFRDSLDKASKSQSESAFRAYLELCAKYAIAGSDEASRRLKEGVELIFSSGSGQSVSVSTLGDIMSNLELESRPKYDEVWEICRNRVKDENWARFASKLSYNKKVSHDVNTAVESEVLQLLDKGADNTIEKLAMWLRYFDIAQLHNVPGLEDYICHEMPKRLSTETCSHIMILVDQVGSQFSGEVLTILYTNLVDQIENLPQDDGLSVLARLFSSPRAEIPVIPKVGQISREYVQSAKLGSKEFGWVKSVLLAHGHGLSDDETVVIYYELLYRLLDSDLLHDLLHMLDKFCEDTLIERLVEHESRRYLFACIWSRSTDLIAELEAYKNGMFINIIHDFIASEISDPSNIDIPLGFLLDSAHRTKRSFVPLEAQWQEAIQEVLPMRIPVDIQITHPIAPLTRFVLHEHDTQLSFDIQGRSKLLRFAQCIHINSQLEGLHDREQLTRLLFCIEMINMKMQNSESNKIFQSEAETLDIMSLVDSKTDILIELCSEENIAMVIKTLLELVQGEDHKSYIYCMVMYDVLTFARESDILGPEEAESLYEKSTKSIFSACTSSTVLVEFLLQSKKASFSRNKLASDLSSRKCSVLEAEQMLVKLNSLIPAEHVKDDIMPRQRLLFLVQNILKWAHDKQQEHFLYFQLTTLFLRLFPILKSEYGSFWESAIKLVLSALQEVVDCEERISTLPLQYSTLKLVTWLDANNELNDDLSEFWQNHKRGLEGLIARIFVNNASLDQSNQATSLCSLIVARQMRAVTTLNIDEDIRERLYGMLVDSPEHLQLTAYHTLEKIVEEERESMIMSAALTPEYEEVDVTLPNELLSLILDHPLDEGNLVYLDFHELLPIDIRAYFMSWLLVFSYFTNSGLRMRVKLTEDLQEGAYLDSLLVVIFRTLRLTEDRPIDISKVSKDSLDIEVSGKAALIAYTTHLYYLALLHLPNIVRAWWMNCKDRALTSAVELFTERYFSPLLVQHDLSSVHTPESKKVLNDDKLSIKIVGQEVQGTYEVDEESMQIAIRLPQNYPLRKVTVEGLQRVGVKDNQWRAWLLASQAILTAQNGSIVDALSLFQRNVALHFEGVQDCAICFSVLSVQDKSLPTKRCATCKNKFHGSCIYKWFKSSNSSKCPLCRTSFTF